jgi:hypothetical protein
MGIAANRLTLGVIVGSLIVGSSMIVTTGAGPKLLGYPALGIIGYLISALFGSYYVIYRHCEARAPQVTRPFAPRRGFSRLAPGSGTPFRPPGVLEQAIVPPWATTISRAIARPMPAPGFSWPGTR